MLHDVRLCKVAASIYGLLCMMSFIGLPASTNAKMLTNDVEEKVVNGKTVLVIAGKEWPVTDKPETVFITTAPSPSEKKQGYIIYHHRASDEVFENSAPRRGERTDTLETIVTRGEKRHVQFAIYALKDLGNVRADVADLVSAAGIRISKDAMDVRVVKSVYRRARAGHCHRVPHLLIKPKDAPAVTRSRTQQFWITIAVPKDTAAGTYRGKIKVTAEKGGEGELELIVHVPDFTLVEPMWWGMYYYSGWNGNITKRVFQDMLDHGMTGILYCDGKREPLMKKVDDKVELSFPNADRCMPVLKELGFRDVIYYPRLLSNKLIILFGMEKDFKPHKYYGTKNVLYKADRYPTALKPVLRDVFRQIDAHAKEAGWPYPLIYYPVDEPHYKDAVMEWALVEMPTLKDALPSARIFCTAYWLNVIKKLDPWLDITAVKLRYLAVEETNKAIMTATGGKAIDVWGIFWFTPTDDYQSMRTKAGLLPEKTGAEGMTLWTYYGPYDHKDDYDELRGSKYKYAAPSYLAPDGTLLTTVPWEAIREGINDSRYARTVRHWIKTLRKLTGATGLPRGKKVQALGLADDAETFLKDAFAGIPWGMGAHKGKWTELDADNFRHQAAGHIQALKSAASGLHQAGLQPSPQGHSRTY